jgi:hypothetical protein
MIVSAFGIVERGCELLWTFCSASYFQEPLVQPFLSVSNADVASSRIIIGGFSKQHELIETLF